jgi:hypothetical protein
MRTVSLLTLIVILLSATPQWSGAASNKCVVVETDENRIILECSKEVSDFVKGSEVKIKSVKKAAVEGC